LTPPFRKKTSLFLQTRNWPRRL